MKRIATSRQIPATAGLVPTQRCSSPESDVCEEQRSTGTSPVVAASTAGPLLARSNARRGHAPSWRRPRRGRCWRGATLDGDKPRRGGVHGGVVAGEEQRSTGTSPVVAASTAGSLLARSNARRGHAPSWRRPRRGRCWRGATLDGDKPRRGGVHGGIVAGEEQRSTGTSPVVAASTAGPLLVRSNAQRGQAPSWRRPRRGRCWRGATLDGDKPRRGGVHGGIVAGEEQRSTGTCPVVACSPSQHWWRQALATKNQEPRTRTRTKNQEPRTKNYL